MTWRQAWEWCIKPALDQQKEWNESHPRSGGSAKPQGGFDPRRATKEEMDAFLDKLCGKKAYEGVRFWIPEEAAKHGIKTYNGKDN